jgi:FdhE protein
VSQVSSYEFIKAWRERARAWQAKVPAPREVPPEAAAEQALLAGEPLVTLADPVIPAGMFGDVVAELAELLAQYRSGSGAEEAQVLGRVVRAADADDREALVQAVLTGSGSGLEAWAERHDASGALLITVASMAVQPFMARFAEAVSEVAPLGLWRAHYCPVCGGQADVCRIDPENLRHLHCPQCDTQWEHHRLTCANCDTDDIKKVNILTVESLEPWRVEVCDVCGGYTKTLDQRHGGHLAMPRVDLFVEDARTLPLDVLAEQEGYRRGGRAQ